jgi:DNA mismatch endonuclease, patch repair protein
MTDVLTPEQRSRCMSAVRSTNTSPEIFLLSHLRSQGFRFFMHSASLPGKPDFVFPRRRKVILVHGCFWHRHNCKAGRSIPSTRRRFWFSKLEQNRKRDTIQLSELRRLGWRVLIIWQCQLKGRRASTVLSKVAKFLGSKKPPNHAVR